MGVCVCINVCVLKPTKRKRALFDACELWGVRPNSTTYRACYAQYAKDE